VEQSAADWAPSNPRLLRLLQEHEIKRVSGTHVIKVDVRVLAATNQHLEALVKAHKFAEFFLRKSTQASGKRVERIAPRL
jgi:transcriptional regulator with GAF, ATPase, and Fis domain